VRNNNERGIYRGNYLKEFWDNPEMYRGLKQRDLTILRNLTYPEWISVFKKSKIE